MIYRRPHSVNIGTDLYIKKFGSITKAKNTCFNIGAGTWLHPCWTNLDLPPQSKAFAKIQSPCIYHDLVEAKDLPIKSSTANLLYCSHVIEHLPEACVEKLFRSAYRALRSGGIFRIVTGPDADIEIKALLRNDLKWWYFYEDIYAKKNTRANIFDYWLLHTASPRSVFSLTPCDKKYTASEIIKLVSQNRAAPEKILDLMTRGLKFQKRFPSDHLSWWNANKLIHKLRAAGFTNVEKSAYGQSISPFLRDLSFFDMTYPQISVYVEARK